MSADNYMYVFQHQDKFYVEMLSASCEYSDEVQPDGLDDKAWLEPYPLVLADSKEFNKISDAIEYAGSVETEYGWLISPKIGLPTYADLLRKWERDQIYR